MTPERYKEVGQLYRAALEVEPERREAFLAGACGDDDALRQEVESLLDYAAQSGGLIDQHVLSIAAKEIAGGQPWFPVGESLGHYRIISLLGKGGMGEVYCARDTKLDRTVALKLLPAELASNQDRMRRFVREAKAASALNHPNILTIHEIDEADGAHYIVSEFVEGQTLRALIDCGELGISGAIGIAEQVACALGVAHGAGIIHRDIKPENVMVRPDGLVKVLDFGLAKLTEGAAAPIEVDLQAETLTRLSTEPGVVMGTVSYMSPEQARGQAVDHRTDIFSLGVMLYEMVAGSRPFEGATMSDVIAAILRETPAPLSRHTEGIPNPLQQIVNKMLAKRPEERYQSVREVANDLKECHATLSVPATPPSRINTLRQVVRRPLIAFPVVLALIGAIGLLSWYVYLNAKARWAREQAIPEIIRLIQEDKYTVAFDLAREAEKYIPADPALSRLWTDMSREYSVFTTPSGADLYVKEYMAVDRDWEYLGRSPIERVRIPIGLFRWKIEKDGYNSTEGASAVTDLSVKAGEFGKITFVLEGKGRTAPGMVRVTGGIILPFMSSVPMIRAQLPDYLIDKYEVTNKQFREFVSAGGYQKREYWKHSFVKDGRILTWEEAMAEFRDATGRPGPSTWELGDFEIGHDDYPVAGVSWYEAAAYSEFAGKSLPTVYHWIGAIGRPLTPPWRAPVLVSPLSNIGGGGLARVGTYQGVGAYGTYDMAGNVREWCWNESGNRRLMMGGAWNEPAYMFDTGDAQSPFDRSPTNGFRCVRQFGPDAWPKAATRPLPLSFRDYAKEKPVSDDVFRIYQSLYSYDRAELNAKVEEVDDRAEYWIRQKISFDAAYGNERMSAYLFLPKKASPPYQTMIYFPGVGLAFNQPSLVELPNYTDFLIKSGRALLIPVYKGTFERRDGYVLAPPYLTAAFRDHMIQWSKDLGRSIDYLESRPDIAHDKLGYHGISLGTAVGSVLVGVEKRLKVGIFIAGGLGMHKIYPEVDSLHFAPRVRVPVLMINGRYDSIFPYETSQLPLFRLLGTPESEKRHLNFETTHTLFPRNQLIKEVIDWLDRYLGAVSEPPAR